MAEGWRAGNEEGYLWPRVGDEAAKGEGGITLAEGRRARGRGNGGGIILAEGRRAGTRESGEAITLAEIGGRGAAGAREGVRSSP